MAELTCIWDAKAELGEGVFWHEAEQAVYWVDIIQSRLHRFIPRGGQDSWHFAGHISAVVPCSTGGLLATFENGLAHIDLATETVTPLLALETDLPDNRFNDGCSDTRGQFWFGSMDDQQVATSGSFYRMDGHGEVQRLDSFGKICITNGPAFSTDGHWVYFTDSVERKIFRAPLDEQGVPGRPALFIEFSDTDGHPDGMCTDLQGGLWVCHFGAGRVTRFLEDGQPEHSIAMPVPNITKCAFGGPQLSTLYITTAATGMDAAQRQKYPLAGGLFAMEQEVTGVATVAVARPCSTSTAW